MARSRWADRDLPILEYFAELERVGTTTVIVSSLAGELGIDAHDTSVGLRALADGKYISWGQAILSGHGDVVHLTGPRLLERGRREVGQWPVVGIDSLVALLEARIAKESDAAQRSRLEQLRDALLGVGRDVGTSLLTAWVKSQTNLS